MDIANRYADGWYAAHVGWPHHYPDGIPCNAPLEIRRAAYDQGFTDGGGDRTDLFDAARRANLALHRQSNRPAPMVPTAPARPLPSSWPKPSDEARPARWSRRLAILSYADLAGGDPTRAKWDFLRIVRDRPGAEAIMLLILTDAGFVQAGDYTPSASLGGRRKVTGPALRQQLVEALSGHEIDDILVALQDEDLRLPDEIGNALPLCRTMERTRNTKLQQRTHLRTWLDRGYGEDENMAAGHIRWGKLIQGLVGKLGEFTVRHVGPASVRGQLIRVEVADGQLAAGYADADGTPIAAEIIVSSKAKLRSEMAATLRHFGAATTMMAASARHAA